jgi:NADP-reducing hydrogenase subunit HndB
MVERIKSIEDLKKLREQAQDEIGLRRAPDGVVVNVHMGTCGIAAGARDVLAQFMTELAQAGLKRVVLRQSGCIGLCSHEPMLTLTDQDGHEFKYGGLDRKKVQEIVREHLVGGHPLTSYLVQA